jgi:hypothetical protein
MQRALDRIDANRAGDCRVCVASHGGRSSCSEAPVQSVSRQHFELRERRVQAAPPARHRRDETGNRGARGACQASEGQSVLSNVNPSGRNLRPGGRISASHCAMVWYTHSRVLLFSRILKVIVCGADLVMAGRAQTSYRRWPMAIPKLSAF